MKRNLLYLSILIFGLLLAGIGSLAPGLLVLALPLLVYLLAAVLHRPEAAQIRIERSINPQRVEQGKPVTVTLRLTNEGKQLEQFGFHDQYSRGIKIQEGFTSGLACLAGGESVEIAYTISAFRGAYDHFEVHTTTSEALDCFELSENLPSQSPFIIYPRHEKISPVKIRPPRTHGFAGSITARQSGTGVDFFTVREYQQGDSLRHINWRRSARDDDHFYTNTYEQDQVTDVGIILDARTRVNLSNGLGSLFEHSVGAAASLASQFLQDGHRVSLLVYGSSKRRVFPGYGKVQEKNILDTLSGVAPVINFALTNFDNLPVRFFPTGSQIVMISPIVMEDIPYIHRMRARGYAVMVLSPDPITFEAAEQGDFSSRFYRLAYAEREFMLQQLRQSGTQVISWQVDQPLEAALQRATFNQHRSNLTMRRGV